MTDSWTTRQIGLYEQAHADGIILGLCPGSIVEASGANHLALLHSILSQDILGMLNFEWRRAALLSATSHVLVYLYVLKLPTSVLLISAPNLCENLISLLNKFIITEDVALKDASSAWQLHEAWGKSDLPLKKDSCLSPAEGSPLARRFILSASDSRPNNAFGWDSRVHECLRIENGLLEFGPDINETMMLSETRLEKIAASETKGCYPGQEVVAKIETYKRLNRSMVKLLWQSDDLPETGAAILTAVNGEEIGHLTSRAWSPHFKKTFGLGWLKRGFFEKPVEVAIKSKTSVPAKTASLS